MGQRLTIMLFRGGSIVLTPELHLPPTYSSWLNQVEIWFARIEREVIARGVFTSVQDLARKLMRYIRAYSRIAKPFRWKYSDIRNRVVGQFEIDISA